ECAPLRCVAGVAVSLGLGCVVVGLLVAERQRLRLGPPATVATHDDAAAGLVDGDDVRACSAQSREAVGVRVLRGPPCPRVRQLVGVRWAFAEVVSGLDVQDCHGCAPMGWWCCRSPWPGVRWVLPATGVYWW